MGILEGIRVIDFTHMIAGPLSTMVLADLGADVIKIEPPEGETARHLGDPYWTDQTDYFIALNRNKRSVVLDLKSPSGIDAVRALIADADIVVENFRAGTADKLGLGYDALAELNPRLIYCSISGFGPDGPYADRPAVDPIVQALSGIMQLTGTETSGPLKTGFPLGDYVTPLFGAIGMLAALIEREKTGKGQRIDVSMLDATVFSMIPREGGYFAKGLHPIRRGNGHTQLMPANTYHTADGRQIMLFCHNPKFWQALIDVLGDEGLRTDPRFATNAARIAARDELEARIGAAFLEHPLSYWLPRIERFGASAAPVRTFDEVFADPEILRHVVATVDHPTAGEVSLLKTPIRFSETPVTIRAAPPLLGQHNDEVLGADRPGEALSRPD